MNKIVFSWFVAMAFAFVFGADANAQLFGRRGCSTGHCFTPAVHHAPAIVKSPDFIQTFVFNNIAPPGDLSARGDTLYGVARALEYNSPNGALYLDQSRRALEVASEFTSAARAVDGDILEAMKVDARGRAVASAFRELREDATTRSTTTTTRITLRNGIPVFEEEPAPVARGGISCLKCHAVDGSAAEKFVIDDTFTFAKYQKAKAAVESGAMPPKGTLSDSEKDAVVWQLGKLVP